MSDFLSANGALLDHVVAAQPPSLQYLGEANLIPVHQPKRCQGNKALSINYHVTSSYELESDQNHKMNSRLASVCEYCKRCLCLLAGDISRLTLCQ